MKRERNEYRRPYGHGDYQLHRSGEGVYWRAASGLTVRMAAPEQAPEAQPPRRSQATATAFAGCLAALPARQRG
jgi:hypothetical protein